MKEKIFFRLILTFPTLAALAVNLLTFVMYIPAEDRGWAPAVLALMFLAVLALIHFIFLKTGRIFDRTREDITADEDEYREFLTHFGELPLKAMKLFLLVMILVQASAYFYLTAVLPQDSTLILLYVLLNFSFDFLFGAFVFVLGDKLVLNGLLKWDLTHYPAGIKSNRQIRKNFIIPVFMTVMTIMVTFFITLILLFGLQDLGQVDPGVMISEIILKFLGYISVYFITVVALVVTWARNTQTLYKHVIDQMNRMTSADKDIRGRVSIGSVDEIGLISGSINHFSDMISKNLRDTRQTFEKMSRIQTELFESIAQSSESVNSIAEKLDETIRIIEEENQTAGNSGETGKTLVQNVNGAVQKLTDQAASVQQSSKQVEEMIESIRNLNEKKEADHSDVEELVEKTQNGAENLKATLASVEKVAGLSEKIMEVNNMISGIASQTNLLSMNAAIEAAHAGESGRGFSVVADEIRKLAENTSGHLKSSKESLKQISEEIEQTRRVARQTGDAFDEMKQQVGSIRDSSSYIARNLKEHDRANHQILDSLQKTLELTDELNGLAGTLEEEGDGMIKSLEELTSKSQSAQDNAQTMKEKNGEVVKSVKRVDELSDQTNDINEKAMALINHFQLE